MKKILFASLIIAGIVPLFSSAQINISTNLIIPTVEMVWEAHSYTPPLYRGKALYPVGGEVTVYAFPPRDLGDPSTLSYTWKRDGEVQGDLSGIGKRSFTFFGSQFGDSPLIVVEISNGTKDVVGALRMQQTNPLILFYENTALGGIAFETALQRNSTRTVSTTDSVGIEAYPYYVSSPSRINPTLSYEWSVNGRRDSNITTASLLLQAEEPRSVYLQLLVANTKELLQRATGGLSVTFE